MSTPPPEVTARLAADDELPRSAKSLIKKAVAADWATRATYARGTDIGKKARPVVDSVMVRLSRPPFHAVAVWHDGSFEMGYAWVEGLNARRRGARHISKLVEVAS